MSNDEVSVADPRAVSRDLFSATLGSICCCYTGQPLDTVKVRMQTNPQLYKGVWSSASNIVTGEGVTALWKGAIPTGKHRSCVVRDAFSSSARHWTRNSFIRSCIQYTLHCLSLALGMAAENAVAFGVNEALKRAFPDDPLLKLDPNKPPDLLKPFAMGTLTGCCSAMVLLPSEIVKAKTQVLVGEHSSAEVVREMMKRQGIRVRLS